MSKDKKKKESKNKVVRIVGGKRIELVDTLAVKWRPKQLNDIVGNEGVVTTIKGMIKKRQMVRSWMFAGPTGSGKCVVGDTYVLGDKGLKEIKDYVNINLAPGFQKLDKSKLVNRNGKLEEAPFSFYENSFKTFNITTHHNFTLNGTPEHKILILTKKGFKWRRLDKLEIGDKVAIQRGMEIWSKENKKFEFNKSINLNSHSCYDCIKKCKKDLICEKFSPFEKVRCLICEKDFGNLSMHLQTHNINKEYYLKEYPKARLTSTSQSVKNERKSFINNEKIPKKMTKSLARVIGYLVAEGTFRKINYSFHMKNKKVMKDFISCFYKCFGIKLEVKVYDNKIPCVRIFGLPVRILSQLGLYKGHSYNREIPKSILEAPRKYIIEYLKAYYEGDGGFSSGSIEASSASKKLLRQTQMLLLNIGIVSKISDKEINNDIYYRLFFSGSDVDTFFEEIGFISNRKNNLYDSEIERYSVKNKIPYIRDMLYKSKAKSGGHNGYYSLPDGNMHQLNLGNYSKEIGFTYFKLNNYIKNNFKDLKIIDKKLAKLFKRIYKTNYFWDEITKINRDYNVKLVYDFNLPKTRSFFGNGFINHNTSFSRLVAKIVNCSNLSKKGKLCGKCDSCLEDIKYHSDIMEINGTVNRKIENVRSILESSTLSPRYNYRCYIIDEIQGLTYQAKEALLKPIEEPPPKTIWFLCTTEPDKLPATLTGGRTLRMYLNYPSKEELGKRLKKIAKKEFDEDIFKLFKPHFESISEAGRCQPRDSIAMMEQISDGIVGSNYSKLSKKKVKKLVEMFISSLGNLEFEAIRFLLCMYTKKYRLPLEMINKIDQTKLEDFMKLLNDYSHYAALYIINKKAEKRIDRKWFYNINKIKWESALDKNKVTNFKIPLLMCDIITEAMEKVRRGLVTNHQVMLSIVYKFMEGR